MTLADEIKRVIVNGLERIEITSSGGDSPKINTVIPNTISIETPDLDGLVSETSDDIGEVKEDIRVTNAIKKVEAFDKGKVGELNRFTSSQMANLRGFVDNPVQFIIQSVFKKFARGVGIVAFALIIFEAVKWIIGELLKPGRLLDLRFKRVASEEILAFRRREDQQRIKQGLSNIIITTTPRLRGGQGQIVNTFNAAAGREQFPDTIGQAPILLEASGASISKIMGGRRSGLGPGR
jgi:hypothetical protein